MNNSKKFPYFCNAECAKRILHDIRIRQTKGLQSVNLQIYPTVSIGPESEAFILSAVVSSREEACWYRCEPTLIFHSLCLRVLQNLLTENVKRAEGSHFLSYMRIIRENHLMLN